MKPSNVTSRELYHPSSKFKGETRRRILPATACSCSLRNRAALWINERPHFREVSRNTVAKCRRIRDAEVSSASVGTRKTNS